MATNSFSYKTVAANEVETEIENSKRHKDEKNYIQQLGRSDRLRYGSFHIKILKQIKYVWRNTKQDLNDTSWLWLATRLFSHLMPLIFIVSLIVAIAMLSHPDRYFFASTICDADGAFSLSFAHSNYNLWTEDSLFTINIGLGSFPFGIAKLIDVIWDVGVGRGGQALTAYITYQVFTRAISRSMESKHVTTDTFKATTLETSTLHGAFLLSKDFLKHSGLQTKIKIFLMGLMTIFCFSLPTWLSAMTGYTAVGDGFVYDNNANLVPADKFLPAVYIIHDGARLGDPYYDGYPVEVPWQDDVGPYLVTGIWQNSYPGYSYGCTWNQLNATNNSFVGLNPKRQIDDRCTLLWLVSDYTHEYGLLGLKSVESTFGFPNGTETTIESPSLNITIHYSFTEQAAPALVGYMYGYSWSVIPYGFAWPTTDNYGKSVFPFTSQSNPMFSYSNTRTLYNLVEYNQQGNCQTERNSFRYTWGFSYTLLYLFFITTLVWTIAMYALYLDAYLYSQLDVARRHIGLERAVLDYSAVIRNAADYDNKCIDMDDNKHIKELVRDSRMTYVQLPLDSTISTRRDQLVVWWKAFDLKRWAISEQWWLAALLLFTILFIASYTFTVDDVAGVVLFWNVYTSCLPVVGVLLVLASGRKHGGRWLVFTVFFLIHIVVTLVFMAITIIPGWQDLALTGVYKNSASR